MTYRSIGEVATLHDRATRGAGSGTVVLGLQKDWLKPAADRLGDIAITRAEVAIFRVGNRADGWDGYGGPGANRESVARAATIVESLVRQANQTGCGWTDAHVGLNESGDVSLEWWNGEKKLTLYICPEATEYVCSWGPNIETQMDAGCLDASGSEDFANYWRWLWTPSE